MGGNGRTFTDGKEKRADSLDMELVEMQPNTNGSEHRNESETTNPMQHDDQVEEHWDEFLDEATGFAYYISNLTERSTWTNHNEEQIGLTADEVDQLWEEFYDEASGHNYYVNRENRTVTWTDRRALNGSD